MKKDEARFDRNIRLFGTEGQKKLRDSHVAVVGVGGLGSHVVQQLSLLGIGALIVIDDEEISVSNKNRYVGTRCDDPVPGSKKVEVARRLAGSIDPTIKFDAVHANLLSRQAFDAIKRVDHLFGCLDNDGPRFVLNDVATAYAKPYIDLASDVVGQSFGGRVVVNWDGRGCLYCLDEIEQSEVQRFLENSSDRANREAVYGVPSAVLNQTGPSVVSVNGVVASLAVTEYMVACTGMRSPIKFINYDGSNARAMPREHTLRPNCPYCGQWGMGDALQLDRYLRAIGAK